MKKHYKPSIMLDRIDEAIYHAQEFSLPLQSIELNPEEWIMFRQAAMAIPGWRPNSAAMMKEVHYQGIRIFEGPAP